MPHAQCVRRPLVIVSEPAWDEYLDHGRDAGRGHQDEMSETITVDAEHDLCMR